MKILALFLFPLLVSGPDWGKDFDKAKSTAQTEHKYILLNFSGSDWCGPCIRMEKEFFNADEFKKLADKNLILVNADFPRLRKHQLAADQQQRNEKLAEKYNPEGIFPLTILFNADGKLIHKWEGFPNESAKQFVQELNNLTHASN